MTDTRIGEYAPCRASVTCGKCGNNIPPTDNMLIRPRLNNTPEPTCIPCMQELIATCRPYYCCHVPWEGPGVRDHRNRGDYQHWCDRCGRPFLGALARRYCSDACAELTRRERRPSRRRPACGITCWMCGETFTPPRSDAVYCSAACRQKAYRTRRMEAVTQDGSGS